MTTMTEQEHPLSSGERILNNGIEVQLKKLGSIRVKELSLEQLLQLVGDLALLFDSLPAGEMSGDNMAFLRVLLTKPETAESVRKVAAAATTHSPDDFVDMGVSDWLRFMKAFRDVTDWEEIRELFLEVVPKELFEGLTTTFQMKASTSEPQSPE